VLIPDVNVLVHAWRGNSPDHEVALHWLEEAASSNVLGLPDQVLAGAVRILTMRVRGLGADVAAVLNETSALLTSPGVRRITPGARHWGIFDSLCRELGATGNQVPDCYLAALAIEKQATFVSTDRFFATVPNLDWMDLSAAS